MKLKEVILKNFRPYKEITRIPFEEFTALIGKNDVGKSCILEALAIFFDSPLVTLDRDDVTKPGSCEEIIIGCVFSDLPNSIVLDEDAQTSLSDEFLLNTDGNLEIHRVFDCSLKKIKDSVFALANHPTARQYNDLLLLKNSDLKKRFDDLQPQTANVNRSINRSLRKAIWDECTNLALAPTMIPLDKEDAKKIWNAIEQYLPIYALFQSDRPSRDEDTEVQDPMKAAIVLALKAEQARLDEIKQSVRRQTTEVAVRTLEKLKELDAGLANELCPTFKVEPKWDQIFKMTLTGDEQIPINKRGSGVRRLILLSFFRAEAERLRIESPDRNLIYAIEEPETSQHPNFQRLLIEALLDLSQVNCQVIVTTHNPALAAYVPMKNLRLIQKWDQGIRIRLGDENDEVLEDISRTLGVLPDNRIKAIVCVEGWSDIEFLKRASHVYSNHLADIRDLSITQDVAFVPLGGSTLQQWVDQRYLKGFGRPEVHLYDLGSDDPPQYSAQVAMIEARGEIACLTGKREIENYIHQSAIQELYPDVKIPLLRDTDRVPEIVAKAVHESAADIPWNELNEEKREKKISRVKYRLAKEALLRMDYARFREADRHGDIPAFLRLIQTACAQFDARPVA